MISEKYFHLFSVSGLFSFTICVIMMSEQERFLPMMARFCLLYTSYPQVIPAFFNRRLVRSSMELYLHFNLLMDCLLYTSYTPYSASTDDLSTW